MLGIHTKRMGCHQSLYNRGMPADRATHLAQQLLPSVSQTLAAAIAAYDWQQAQRVERGKDHTVLLADRLAVARIPRKPDPQLARTTQLIDQLDLPWLLPTALSTVEGGVLQRFIPGTAHPHGVGNAERLAQIVSTFSALNTAGLPLNVPFAQRGRLTPKMLRSLDAVVDDHMAWEIAEHVHGWTDDGIGGGLVHGDLAGHNMHWVDGELIGVLDWDYAAYWDTALNATYLSLWHGVEFEAITPAPNRARVWSGALGLYSLANALTWDISPGGWRRLNKKVQPRILAAYRAIARAED